MVNHNPISLPIYAGFYFKNAIRTHHVAAQGMPHCCRPVKLLGPVRLACLFISGEGVSHCFDRTFLNLLLSFTVRKEIADAVIKAMAANKNADISADNLVVR